MNLLDRNALLLSLIEADWPSSCGVTDGKNADALLVFQHAEKDEVRSDRN
ncbi:MAG: hypothetical protein ABSB74_02210 [Tepidisphaeraceae bacterium]